VTSSVLSESVCETEYPVIEANKNILNVAVNALALAVFIKNDIVAQYNGASPFFKFL
jgi:hypothetical protein